MRVTITGKRSMSTGDLIEGNRGYRDKYVKRLRPESKRHPPCKYRSFSVVERSLSPQTKLFLYRDSSRGSFAGRDRESIKSTIRSVSTKLRLMRERSKWTILILVSGPGSLEEDFRHLLVRCGTGS